MLDNVISNKRLTELLETERKKGRKEGGDKVLVQLWEAWATSDRLRERLRELGVKI